MNKIWGYFKKVRTELLVLLIIAIVTYFTIEVWLNNYPEIFHGANKIGQFFSKLSISYISSFIFYFIVVHIKGEKDKQNINEFVGYKVYQIVTRGHLVIQPLQQKFAKNTKFEYMESGLLYTLLNSIDKTTNEAPYTINDRNANWIQWYEYLKESSQEDINDILTRYSHLDTKLIKLLTRIENSLFFTQFNLLYVASPSNMLSVFHFQIETYLNHIKELEQYADKNFKQYQNITSDFVGKR